MLSMFKKTYVIGIHIAVERKARDISQEKFASLIHYSVYAVRRIEGGGSISEEALRVICDVLRLDFDALVDAERKEQYRQETLRMSNGNLTAEEQEVVQSVITKFEPPKHKSFLKRVFGILVVIAALTLASTIAYASYRKIYLEIAAIDKEHNRIVLRTREEGVEDDYVYQAPEDDVFPDYVRGETYQSSDHVINREYFKESEKMKIKCITAEGQEYLYCIQEAGNFTEEHMKKALNYSCEEKEIILDDKTITLYYTENKALFLLENLLYVFPDYNFPAEQLIPIIKNMKKQIVHNLQEEFY